ncbi:protoglobin domain-containing protein [Paenibacillaceae bacterium WGS1546]|uniref:protoglobin domain-containing protein n=1 Tax=Cohnella sp. WGS1546 TaxID=3366810 RepID=UPI00372D87DB
MTFDSDQRLDEQLQLIGLSEEDERAIQAVRPLILEQIEQIIESFYAKIGELPHLQRIVSEHSTIDRLKSTLRRHVVEMFESRIDADYIRKRLRIAEVHQRIGLEPKWYIGSFQNLQNAFLEILHRRVADRQDLLTYGKSVAKLLNLEQQLVIEAYHNKNIEEREKVHRQVREEVKHRIGAVSQELAALAEQTSAAAEQLVFSSGQVNDRFLQSAEMSADSRAMAIAGTGAIDELDRRMEAIRERSASMETSLSRLDRSSGQIKTIVRIVQSIAGQTKILSLNASIEAVRAGKHGAGFAVVAAEVKRLSDDTAQAVKQISELIAQSHAHTGEVVESISEIERLVELGQLQSEQTRTAFERILLALDASIAEIDLVEKELEALVKVIGEVGLATSKVAGSAEELNNVALRF